MKIVVSRNEFFLSSFFYVVGCYRCRPRQKRVSNLLLFFVIFFKEYTKQGDEVPCKH